MKRAESNVVKERETTVSEREGAATAEAPASGSATTELEASLEQELEVLREQLQEQQRLAAEAQDNFLRARADFDNFRRRLSQEMEDVRRFGVEQMVSNLLPVLDNFERAMEAAQTSQNADALHEGVSLIHKQLQEVLTKAGVQPILAVGQPFDPTQHEAIMQVEAGNGHEPNTVVEELRRGYRLHDRVIRASLVKVAA